MGVDGLPRGGNQPFYNVISITSNDDGLNTRCKYDFIGYVTYTYYLVLSSQDVAEDNILPVAFRKEHVQVLFQNCAQFPIYFNGNVDFPSEPHNERNTAHVGARGRLHMSPQARYAYPDDEAVALRWMEHGVFS